jgi:uncharacterized protein YjbJ (UPF0337 family)
MIFSRNLTRAAKCVSVHAIFPAQIVNCHRRFPRLIRVFLSEVRTAEGFYCYPIAEKKPNYAPYEKRLILLMNSSTKDKVRGTARETVGKVKEETGKAIGNPNLRDRGTAEKVAGKVERKVGDVKKVFGK